MKWEDNLGLADINHFAQFIRGTKVPPRDAVLCATAAAQEGQTLFETIGCATCHVSTIVTAPGGTVINGGAFTVPEALGNKIIHSSLQRLLASRHRNRRRHRPESAAGYRKQIAYGTPVGTPHAPSAYV